MFDSNIIQVSADMCSDSSTSHLFAEVQEFSVFHLDVLTLFYDPYLF